VSTFNGLAVHVLLFHVIVVLALESHVSEVIDGMPARSEPGAVPRPEYDVTRTTLRQRELAKVAELERLQRPIGLEVFHRYRHRYSGAGIAALVDKRRARRSTVTGRVDGRYVDAFRRSSPRRRASMSSPRIRGPQRAQRRG
jgi:hypothetical protein